MWKRREHSPQSSSTTFQPATIDSQAPSSARSEYAYHPRSSSMSPQHLRTKSRSAANYLHRTITIARRTNIRSSLTKIRLTVSFYIHQETPIPLDHARTRKNVVLHIDIYNGGTTNLSCITPTEPKRKTTNSWGAFRSMQQKQRFFNDVYFSTYVQEFDWQLLPKEETNAP
jgi:hypothetical protein